MTGHDWICAKNYNLSIDTSLQALDDIAELIIDLAAKQRQVAPATGRVALKTSNGSGLGVMDPDLITPSRTITIW